MIELRYVVVSGEKILQERHLTTSIDASGALNVFPGPQWSEWRDVEITEEI